MEQFNENNIEAGKENKPEKKGDKNIYFLQLTPSRIIVISSVLVALLILSFLLGINFNTEDQSENLALKDDLKIIDILDREIPPLPLDGNLEKDTPLKSDFNELSAPMQPIPFSKKKLEVPKDLVKSEKAKTVTSAKKEKKKTTTKKGSTAKKVVKKTKKLTYKVVSKKKAETVKNKNKVIATSFKRNASLKKTGSYLIQVASFTKKAKALKEVKRLKAMEYNAFYRSGQVKGKDYYRVRIGPFESKKKALKFLNNLQGKPKYQNSYMIKKTS